MANLLDWKEQGEQAHNYSRVSHDSLVMTLTMEYAMLRFLWEGRVGNDAFVKRAVRSLYAAMDTAHGEGLLSELRSNGGMAKVRPYRQH
jgi:hypothetical protein